MKVLEIWHPDCGSCLLRADDLETKVNNPIDIALQEVRTLIEEGATGDGIRINLLDMSEEQYAGLPEFEGW